MMGWYLMGKIGISSGFKHNILEWEGSGVSNYSWVEYSNSNITEIKEVSIHTIEDNYNKETT